MTDSNPPVPVHLAVVLDRSGSMAGIADEIVGGFNELLAEQRRQPDGALITLAQFDSADPFELLIDRVPLREVLDLDRGDYQPRGATPLYDAIGRMIAHLDATMAGREYETDQVVALITDGMENDSSEHTRSSVFDLVEQRRKDGWAFVFLGANQDAYAEGETMAFSVKNRGNWDATADGSKKMMTNLSRSLSEHRAKPQMQRRREADEFYTEVGDNE
jgi:hypothetical protein